MSVKQLAIPLFALAVALAACGDDKAPAVGGGNGGAVGASASGGSSGSSAGTPGAGGGAAVNGGSSGAGGLSSGVGGAGGGIGSDGSTSDGTTSSGGNAGTIDSGVDRSITSETGADIAVEVRPETSVATAPDTGGADTGAASICPKTFPASSLPGISPADFCALYGQVCKFPGGILHSSMADCMAKYGALSDSVKACRAAHICYATRQSPGTHCLHATGYNWAGCS